MCEPHIVKPKLQRGATQKYKNTNLFVIYASVTIIILFGTTYKSNTVWHASYQQHFTIFLHFEMEINNKKYI